MKRFEKLLLGFVLWLALGSSAPLCGQEINSVEWPSDWPKVLIPPTEPFGSAECRNVVWGIDEEFGKFTIYGDEVRTKRSRLPDVSWEALVVVEEFARTCIEKFSYVNGEPGVFYPDYDAHQLIHIIKAYELAETTGTEVTRRAVLALLQKWQNERKQHDQVVASYEAALQYAVKALSLPSPPTATVWQSYLGTFRSYTEELQEQQRRDEAERRQRKMEWELFNLNWNLRDLNRILRRPPF